MAFGPLSDYHLLPSSVVTTLVIAIVAVGLYLAWVPRRLKGREVSAVGALIAANAAVFILQFGGGLFSTAWGTAVLFEAGLIPRLFLSGEQWWAIVTSMFVHGGLLHFGMNMLVLWFIGSLLERRIGRRRFVLLYLSAGLAAGVITLMGAYLLPSFVHAVIPALPRPHVTNVGASGAIFGLLGYVVVANPQERFMLIFPVPIVMRAWVLAVLFVAFNLVLAFIPGSRIAWWAHLGGMLVGALWARWQKRHGGRVRIDGVTGWGSGGPVQYSYSYRVR